jgi:hypothetical protein
MTLLSATLPSRITAPSGIETVAPVVAFPDERWAAWQARGRTRELRLQKRMTAVVVIAIAGLTFWLTRVVLFS